MADHVHVELSWNLVGWAIGVLLTVGFGVIAVNELTIAKICFALAALLVAIKFGITVLRFPHAFWAGTASFVGFGLLGLLLILTCQWVDRKQLPTSENISARLVDPAANPLVDTGAKTAGGEYAPRTKTEISSKAPAGTKSKDDRSRPIEASGRHLTALQIEKFRAALLQFDTSEVAIFTLKDRPERTAYAQEITEAFRQAGWKPIRNPDRDLEAFKFDRAGVLLIRHSQENTPELKPLIAAFSAAEVKPLVVVEIGPPMFVGFYTDPVNTSMPVVFIGPAIEIPPAP